MKRTGLFAVVCVMGALFTASTTHAHILLTDTTGTKGAVLHMNPDDNPIAGQESTLFFDIQRTAQNEKTTVTLTVNGDGTHEEISSSVDGSLATLRYTFPKQGVYELVFLVTSGKDAYTFSQSWRVSRGVAKSALDTPYYAWAEVLLLASGLAFTILLIIAVNRRAAIRLHSTF